MKELVLNNYTIFIDENKKTIKSIKSGDYSFDFNGSIWQIQFADKTVKKACDMKTFEYTLTDKITFNWTCEDLKVKVNMFECDNNLKMNISVTNDSLMLNRILFPVYNEVEKISQNGDNDYLILPWQNGLIVKNPVDNLLNIDKEVPFYMGRGGKKYENDYPAQYSYQLFAYYCENKKGYYLSCDDGESYIKTVGFHYNEKVDGMDIVFTNYPEGMDEVNFYTLPYNYVFNFFKGDWQFAAKMYRKWALNQKWCKPLKNTYIPKNVYDMDFLRINHEHYYLGTRSEEYIKTCELMKEKLDCRPAMHWYGWNKAPKHGDWYPEMADYSDDKWHDELLKINKKLTDMGVIKIPYVNVHLWDNQLKSFEKENAKDTIIISETRKIEDEPWCPERNLFPICHADTRVKNKANNLFNKIVSEDGFDGIYIDQVASFNASLCFNKEHGHPVGGGKWWAEEYHTMINPLRHYMDKDMFLTTESCCESYHDLFDMMLLVDHCSQGKAFHALCGCENCESIPLFAMLYKDTKTAYGSICRFDDNNDQFEFNFMRTVLWGMVPTAEGMELNEIEDADDKWAILKKGVDFYKENKELIFFGALKKYYQFENGAKEITFGELSKKCPGVIACLYEYENKEYIIAYNYSDNEQTVSVDGKEIKLSPKSFIKA